MAAPAPVTTQVSPAGHVNEEQGDEQNWKVLGGGCELTDSVK